MGSVAFDQKSLFDDDMSSKISGMSSTFLTRFEHSAYVMIPGKLYKYEEMIAVDSNDLEEKSCADLFIPYNIALIYLKTTIFDIIFGKNNKTMDKKQFQKAMKKLKVWVYQTNKQKWIQVTTESDWTHSKLLAQEGSETLKLMYSLHYGQVVSSSSSASISVSSPLKSDDVSKLNHQPPQPDDTASVISAYTYNTDANDSRYSNSNLLSMSRLDIHTPPPDVNVSRSGMVMLKNDTIVSQSKSYFESIPKEQFMANILETRLMKSRY